MVVPPFGVPVVVGFVVPVVVGFVVPVVVVGGMVVGGMVADVDVDVVTAGHTLLAGTVTEDCRPTDAPIAVNAPLTEIKLVPTS